MSFYAQIGEREIEVTTSMAQDLDAIEINAQEYHVLQQEKSFSAKIIEIEESEKTVHVSVNGNTYVVKIQDQLDKAIQAMGFKTIGAANENSLMAPMPGLILDVMVNVGDTVTKGQPLLILEAMKMENVLKAERDGVVSQVVVSKGDAVDKKALLVELEE